MTTTTKALKDYLDYMRANSTTPGKNSAQVAGWIVEALEERGDLVVAAQWRKVVALTSDPAAVAAAKKAKGPLLRATHKAYCATRVV